MVDVYGWMAWSGLLVLVVKCVSKFSLPGGGFILLLFYFIFHYSGGFKSICSIPTKLWPKRHVISQKN